MSTPTEAEIEAWLKTRTAPQIATLLVLAIEQDRGGKLPDGKFTLEVEVNGDRIGVSLFSESPLWKNHKMCLRAGCTAY